MIVYWIITSPFVGYCKPPKKVKNVLISSSFISTMKRTESKVIQQLMNFCFCFQQFIVNCIISKVQKTFHQLAQLC